MKCLVAIFSIPRCVGNETTVEFFGPTQKDGLMFLNERNILKSKNESQFRLERNQRTTVILIIFYLY